MKRRVALVLGTGSLLCCAALYRWYASDGPREVVAPKVREAPTPDPGAQLQLQRETQRLARLRESFDQVAAAPADDPDPHIQRLHHDITALEAELASPLPDGRAFAPVNEEYRRQRLAAQGERQARVLSRRREIDARLAELGTAAAGPGATEGLRALRAELDEELRLIGAATRAPAGGDELAQVRAERADFERRVADLRADLTYWSEQKSGAGDAGKQTRAQNLERQIQEQESTVRALERRARTVVR